MRYLLDTHTLLWTVLDPSHLSETVRSLVEAPQNQVYVSAASSWEIATKYRLGKLPVAEPLLQGFEEQLEHAGFSLLSITSEQARLAGSFDAKHRDPFDRVLAAQAILEELVLLSLDQQLDQFGVRRIW
ncbi:type II toxin-antitoxin system VapC family toxin [Acidipila sp. EB88]|uniref:type II toxin-antitoxin system VapC family toxin n=1 Tax=Acidipila sp. EB88 TaxID=2305226 RepID=UPI000F5E0058|nr:type II toxin-antitoxin system VapC family toxin [Acidipila sp. EB88]RRA48809.1 type II toxin-antitoxin system VapC family toxin [Acidipila sp. EB88]